MIDADMVFEFENGLINQLSGNCEEPIRLFALA
jgi:hypothetical protein